MTNNKSTKRALLTSIVALVLCFTMLLGTTYAWFTDSVSSVNNIIKSGNLDVVLEVGTLNEGGESANPNDWTWTEVDLSKPIIDLADVEPGYVATKAIRVRNNGSLALKFALSTVIVSEKAGVNKYGDEFLLSDSLYTFTSKSLSFTDYDRNTILSIIDLTLSGNFNSAIGSGANTAVNTLGEEICNDMVLLEGESTAFAFGIAMPTWIENEANHNGTDIPEITFGINVAATQYTYENDSFGKDYDENAEYPELSKFYNKEDIITLDSANNSVNLTEDGTMYILTGTFDKTFTINLADDANVGIDLSGATFEDQLIIKEGTAADNVNHLTEERKGNYTIKNAKVNGALSIIASSAESFTIKNCEMETLDLNASNTKIVLDGNKIIRVKETGYPRWDGAQTNNNTVYLYGDNYDLVMNNNIVTDNTNNDNNLIVIQGNYEQFQSKVSTPYDNTISMEENTFTVNNNNLLKIFNDITYAPVAWPAEYKITAEAKALYDQLGSSNTININDGFAKIQITCRKSNPSDPHDVTEVNSSLFN